MSETKELLTECEIEALLDFIQPRCGIPPDIENQIVEQKKSGLRKQLQPCRIYKRLLPALKEELHRQYINTLISPGECVGITGAQSMGEYSTQATLNTFHVAGSDTGNTSGVLRFQDLINASKTVKIETLSLFFKEELRHRPLTELRIAVASVLTEVKLVDLTLDYKIYLEHDKTKPLFENLNGVFFELFDTTVQSNENCLHLTLSKQKLLQHRLYPTRIKEIVESADLKKSVSCVFEPLSHTTEPHLSLLVFFGEEGPTVEQMLALKICGVDGISRIDFKRQDDDSWYLETRGGSIEQINTLSHIFDTTKTQTTSIWDVYHTLGIEATRRFLVKELRKVMDGVDVSHIKLLVERMTHSGTIEPITRYTMRHDKAPLHRASFEESFETFMKAGKFQEVEPFKGVSAAVIGGRKPMVGTYFCDVLVDLKKLRSMSRPLETILERDLDVVGDLEYED